MGRPEAQTPAEESRTAASFLPERLSWRTLERASRSCRGCRLHERATRTVFGEGLVRARLMLLGEMPGDREDREGRRRPAARAGRVGRHRGARAPGRRVPDLPPARPIRGVGPGPHVTAAIHPSAVLRRRTEEERHREMRGLVEDMRQVARALRGGP